MKRSELKQKEQALTEYREYRRNLYKNPVLTDLFLELTSRCNAYCDHCGSRCDTEEKGKEIETRYIKKALKEIADKYEASEILLNVTGGEPLLRKDFFELMNYANELGYMWGITTNGTLLTKNVVKKLIDAGMMSVSVSIDGLEKTHEAFRKIPGQYKNIINGIKYMQESGKIDCVQVTTVANKKNFDELEDLYKYLVSIGVKYWRVVNCDPIGRASDDDILLDHEQYKKLFKFIEEKASLGEMEDVSYGCSHYLGLNLEGRIRSGYFFCMTGVTVGSILSNGDIYVCPNVPRIPGLIQGNIRKDSFIDVWENKYEFFRNEYRTTNYECLQCEHYKFCGGDSMHTWNFEEWKPNICLKDIFDEI